MTLSPRSARDIADRALTHILSDPELVCTLLGVTGATPQGLRAMLGSEALALACLDIIMESDDRVLDFAEAAGLAAQEIAHAHALLSGAGAD